MAAGSPAWQTITPATIGADAAGAAAALANNSGYQVLYMNGVTQGSGGQVVVASTGPTGTYPNNTLWFQYL